MDFLSKFVPLLVYPPGIFVALGLLVLGLSFTRFRRLLRTLLVLGVVGLWTGSTPGFGMWLTSLLEAEYPEVPLDQLAHADVAILLGGLLDQPLPPRLEPDLNDRADRLFYAAELYRAGKVDKILVTGGNPGWSTVVQPEAALLADLLTTMGVPREAIVVEDESFNTHENATNSAKLFAANAWTSGLLVTSAAHMPRALAAFEAEGIPVMPASTDVIARHPFVDSALDLLPDADGLKYTADAMKEWVGLILYRLKGWA